MSANKEFTRAAIVFVYFTKKKLILSIRLINVLHKTRK